MLVFYYIYIYEYIVGEQYFFNDDNVREHQNVNIINKIFFVEKQT